jgi:hypothetical protein
MDRKSQAVQAEVLQRMAQVNKVEHSRQERYEVTTRITRSNDDNNYKFH